YVVQQLLDAVAELDYPSELLTIQVLDDSTDNTADIVATRVKQLQHRGIKIEHVRREKREGFKAGAMAYGLNLTDAEFIAIFDADFVPPSDFLRKTVPHFMSQPRLGIIQTRWGHLNADANWLTRAQSLAIDSHFVVEQTARNRAHFLMTFNGTGGIWRRSCIEDAGGWSSETLTEDLDLSYRAQIRGWQYLYLPQIVVPGEIPPVMTAYKHQQARWSQGTNQCLVKLFVPLWSSDLPLLRKVMAMQHLVQYLPHAIMLPFFLLTPILIGAGVMRDLPLGWLSLISLIPPLMHVITQADIGRYSKGNQFSPTNSLRRLIYFPVLLVIGTGLLPNNAAAAYRAFKSRLTHRSGEFVRTPKFGNRNRQTKAYALSTNWLTWVEGTFALYAAAGVVLALQKQPELAPYLMLYAVAFTAMIVWNFYDQWQLNRLVIAEEPAVEAASIQFEAVESALTEAEIEGEPEYDTIYS
ncbi:MAG TPA: glycosyltransferase, partial [Phototrophicaceae bacterium]|nr:glycosyltransferase [Phototrophicaceae bacterium]